MKHLILLSFLSAACLSGLAQETPPSPLPGKTPLYRATPERINNLVHTKLEARFNYSKAQLNGKVWLTLKPHFYPTDSLTLDAKGMDIHEVAMVRGGKKIPLKKEYNGMELRINLDKKYTSRESYVVYIDYTAKPDEYEGKGSAAITDAKGLYFIDPRDEDKSKPTQIWTQGETEATSVYVPTIDKPNQKTTQEFYLTVPSKFVTLSNGKLVSQKPAGAGLRTDYWKMDQPHAPYLFFIGVGDFAVVKDQYRGKEVSYYVEKEYAPVARGIFGHTPEMMAFFSKITGVDYPWVKYGQMVGRDYVSGAMENTTATLHQESAYQDARELTDGNSWEDVIAHELFHQWFGDYVTTESWSNLTLNESFANYSEYLWNEYKYGKDKADEVNYSAGQGYLANANNAKKDLVRFHYNSQEDMFDAISYNKGGRILHMLRAFIGDSAFFKGMNNYLTTNKYKAAEAHQLRLSFEEVTGKDLNWFFNQWYFGAGHPKLNINYSYAEGKARVIVEQTQTGDKVFTLPTSIALWNGNNKKVMPVIVDAKIDTFEFSVSSAPDAINFDPEKVLLAQRTENKTLDQQLFLYTRQASFLDRREAIEAAMKNQDDATALAIIRLALADRFAPLRAYAIQRIDLKKDAVKGLAQPLLLNMAANERSRPVKAAAIRKLSGLSIASAAPIYLKAVNDSSYSVAGAALDALSKVDSLSALNEAKHLSKFPAKGSLATAITSTLIKSGDESSAEMILKNFEDMPLSQAKFESLAPLAEFLGDVKSMTYLKRGVEAIAGLVMELPEEYRSQVRPYVEGMLKSIQQSHTEGGRKEQADYIESKLAKKDF